MNGLKEGIWKCKSTELVYCLKKKEQGNDFVALSLATNREILIEEKTFKTFLNNNKYLS